MNNNSSKIKTAIVIVLYHTLKTEVERLKKEIKAAGFINCEIFFIDNTPNNQGFAAAVNQGLKKASQGGADIYVVANPDISFNYSQREKLFDAAKYFDLWGLAMKQGSKLYFGGEIDKRRGSAGLIEKRPKQRFNDCDFVSGSLMFIKKHVLEKIGYFDESYFMYYEDVDYCTRAKKAGLKVGIDADLIYEHYEISQANSQKPYHIFASRWKFLLKHGSLKQKLYELIRLPLTIFEEFRQIKTLFFKKPFLFNYFSLNFSSLVNKSLHFILFIFLVRYLNPQEYGIYTLVWVHIGLLLPLLDFGTTSYGLIYLPTQEEKRFSSLFSLRFFLSIVVFISTVFLALIFKYDFALLIFIFITAFVIFSNMLSGSFLVLTSLKQKIYLTSIASLIFNLVLVICSVLFLILFKNLAYIFIAVFIFYNLYSLANLFLIKKNIEELKLEFALKKWFQIIKKSSFFLLISLFAGLYFKLDIFLLNFLKGAKDVGIYSSGYKFLDAMLLFAASYNITASPILARLKKEGKEPFLHKIKKDLLFLFFLGIFVALSIYLLSPLVLPLVLKGEYLLAIPVVRIVIFALPLILISSVFLNGLYVLDKAYVVIFIFLFQICFNLIFNLLFIPKYSYLASAYITVIGEILNVILTFLLFKKYYKNTKHENIN